MLLSFINFLNFSSFKFFPTSFFNAFLNDNNGCIQCSTNCLQCILNNETKTSKCLECLEGYVIINEEYCEKAENIGCGIIENSKLKIGNFFS